MVSPGLVNTEIFQVGNWEDIKQVIDVVPILKPEDIALACVQVLSTPPNVLVNDYVNIHPHSRATSHNITKL